VRPGKIIVDRKLEGDILSELSSVVVVVSVAWIIARSGVIVVSKKAAVRLEIVVAVSVAWIIARSGVVVVVG